MVSRLLPSGPPDAFVAPAGGPHFLRVIDVAEIDHRPGPEARGRDGMLHIRRGEVPRDDVLGPEGPGFGQAAQAGLVGQEYDRARVAAVLFFFLLASGATRAQSWSWTYD